MDTELSGSIFIIDDSRIDTYIIRRFLQQHLEKANSTVSIFEFEVGQKALDHINVSLKELTFKFPKIIFLDINMPDMDGFEFLDVFKKYPDKYKKDSKVIIVSSSDNLKDLERSRKYLEIIGFIKKPIKGEEVLNALKTGDIIE